MLRPMTKAQSRKPARERGDERRVSLFRNGRNQAIRIPRELELEGDEAVIRKVGDSLVIEPVRKGRLLALLGDWDPIDDEFPDVDSDLEPLDEVPL
jgi:antitoxin VapB